MEIHDWVTFFVAVWGAILSTILGIIGLRDRRRRLSVYVEGIAHHDVLPITLVNSGSRPITVKDLKIGVVCRKDNGDTSWRYESYSNILFYPDKNPFPVTLEDGEHINLALQGDITHTLKHSGKSPRIRVYDVEGNVYHKHKKQSVDPQQFGVSASIRRMRFKWGRYRLRLSGKFRNWTKLSFRKGS